MARRVLSFEEGVDLGAIGTAIELGMMPISTTNAPDGLLPTPPQEPLSSLPVVAVLSRRILATSAYTAQLNVGFRGVLAVAFMTSVKPFAEDLNEGLNAFKSCILTN